jgi:ribosomal protein S18 acetylase RimI-like enzyme
MNNTNVRITKIEAADIMELQQLARQTFLEAFAPRNSAENMNSYLNKAFNDQKLMEEINDPDSELYFARIDNRAIGYLKINFGQAQTEMQDDKGLEIERIYVLQEFHGMKIGQVLFDKALRIAKENNVDYLWLGVWEKNAKAIRFYEKNGFVQFGTHVFKLGEEEQTDLLMKLERQY